MARPYGTKKYTPESFADKVEEYIKQCQDQDIFPDEAGMLLYLDISDETLRKYREDKQNNYIGTIKKAERVRESWLTRRVMSDNAKAVTGAIFALKQPKNGGWRDVQETSGAMSITVNLPGMSGSNFGK